MSQPEKDIYEYNPRWRCGQCDRELKLESPYLTDLPPFPQCPKCWMLRSFCLEFAHKHDTCPRQTWVCPSIVVSKEVPMRAPSMDYRCPHEQVVAQAASSASASASSSHVPANELEFFTLFDAVLLGTGFERIVRRRT